MNCNKRLQIFAVFFSFVAMVLNFIIVIHAPLVKRKLGDKRQKAYLCQVAISGITIPLILISITSIIKEYEKVQAVIVILLLGTCAGFLAMAVSCYSPEILDKIINETLINKSRPKARREYLKQISNQFIGILWGNWSMLIFGNLLSLFILKRKYCPGAICM